MKPRLQKIGPILPLSNDDKNDSSEEEAPSSLAMFRSAFEPEDENPIWAPTTLSSRDWVRTFFVNQELAKPCTFYLHIRTVTQHKSTMGIKKAIELIAYWKSDQVLNLLEEVGKDFVQRIERAGAASPLQALAVLIKAIFLENNFHTKKPIGELIQDCHVYFIEGERSFFTRFCEMVEAVPRAQLITEYAIAFAELCAMINGLCLHLAINRTRIDLYSQLGRYEKTPKRLMVKLANYHLFQLLPLVITGLESCIEECKSLPGYSALWEFIESLKNTCSELISVRQFSVVQRMIDLTEDVPLDLKRWVEDSMPKLEGDASIACQELACYLLGLFYQLSQRALSPKEENTADKTLSKFYLEAYTLFTVLVQKLTCVVTEEMQFPSEHNSEVDEGIELDSDQEMSESSASDSWQEEPKTKWQANFFTETSHQAATETISSYLFCTRLSSMRVQIPRLKFAITNYPIDDNLREQLSIFLKANKVEKMLQLYLTQLKSNWYLRWLTRWWMRSGHNIDLAKGAYESLLTLNERHSFQIMTHQHIKSVISVLVNLWSNLLNVPSGTLRPQVQEILQGLLDISLTYDRDLSQELRREAGSAPA
jgi:hypothetical protein